jgi:hypothetical protein
MPERTGNGTNKAMRILFIGIYFFAPAVFGQVIDRWAGNADFQTLTLKAEKREDIFEQFWWTYPGLEKIKIEGQQFEFKGHKYHIKPNDQEMQIYEGENLITSVSKNVSNKIYFDKKSLTKDLVESEHWVQETKFVPKSILLTKVKGNTIYRHYETHIYPETELKWKKVKDSTLLIPYVAYYWFRIGKEELFIYERKNEETQLPEYYFQHPGYIIAHDSEGSYYLLADRNGNGKYTDNQDMVLFNSWNPYLKSSTFRQLKGFLENHWYDMQFLQEDMFLEFNLSDDFSQLIISSRNSESPGTGKSKLIVENVPVNSRLYINDKAYPTISGTNSYNTKSGFFKLRIVRHGYLDFDTLYSVSAKMPEVIIPYKETEKSGKVKVVYVLEGDYYVIVDNDTEQSRKVFCNVEMLNLPEGKNTVTIYMYGLSFEKKFDILQNQEYTFNLEEEMKNRQMEIQLSDDK